MDAFTQAFFECALWASLDDDGIPLDRGCTIADIDKDCLDELTNDCDVFLAEHWDLVASNLTCAGHDFWLTRNRHGAGFWDGDWPEPAATTLTNAAHDFGEMHLYVGEDDRIYY